MPTIDDRFKVTITSSKDPNAIVSWLPEDIEFAVDSQWETPLVGGGSGMLNGVLSTLNLTTMNQWMTISVWTGSSPISMTLPLQFIAENEGEAQTVVMDSVKRLTKLALPSLVDGTTGILHPPGPNPIGKYLNKILDKVELGVGSEDISIKIGSFMQFNNIIVQRVSTSFSSMVDTRGLPMKATVQFTFRTYNTPAKQNLDSIFTASRVRER